MLKKMAICTFFNLKVKENTEFSLERCGKVVVRTLLFNACKFKTESAVFSTFKKISQAIDVSKTDTIEMRANLTLNIAPEHRDIVEREFKDEDEAIKTIFIYDIYFTLNLKPLFSVLNTFYLSLRVIKFKSVLFSNHAVINIIEGLQNCKTIKILSLKECKFTTISFDTLCSKISNVIILRELVITNVRIFGLKTCISTHVKALLTENKHLKKLDISKNFISSITQICDGLSNNNTLRHIIIGHYVIQKYDIDAIINVVNINHSLKTFYILLSTSPSLGIYLHKTSKDVCVPFLKLIDAIYNNPRLEVAFTFNGFNPLDKKIEYYCERNRHNRQMRKMTLYQRTMQIIIKNTHYIFTSKHDI